MKKCSALLTSQEIQIRTTVKHHFTPVRMAIIKKSTNNKCWNRYEEKGTLLHCMWECKLVHPLWKTVLRLLIKLKKLKHKTNRFAIDPAFPLLGIYPDKTII